ncbi:uncharacterized protein LOC131049309 isoform X2 [Cryptomeria japonica]|uniref:uncharacterized protein LOC131049309 isoform X2 n=1 Tax=Cryptomeria japonica TaxID=3369 RepID=UPI0025AC0ECF|nr:uncharacterized protein LOC131049309 isoform X2 [Cryptomeria japonica]
MQEDILHKMLTIHPSRYIFQHCQREEDGMWENLLEDLSSSRFRQFIQKICLFHHLESIDKLIVEFVSDFRAHEDVFSVRVNVISVKEDGIAKATGLTLEDLEVGFWDACMKELDVGMGMELSHQRWCPGKLASAGITGKRACLQFTVDCKDKTGKAVLSLAMQHLSGINGTTCNVKECIDSIDGFIARVNTKWPRFVAQRMAFAFPRLQKRLSDFVTYDSVIAMLLLHQAPGLVKKTEINSGCCMQQEEEELKCIGNSSGRNINVVENASGMSLNDLGNACWNKAQEPLIEVMIEVGDHSVYWEEAIEGSKDVNFEVERVQKFEMNACQKRGEGLDLKKTSYVLAIQTPGITQRCLRGSPSRKFCCSQCPPQKETLKKSKMCGERLRRGQVGELTEIPCRKSRREEYEVRSESTIRTDCRHRAQSAAQKRKSRSITELLVDKKPKPNPPENFMEERNTKLSEDLSSGTKAYNSYAGPLEMEHIQKAGEANLDVLNGYAKKGHRCRGHQESLMQAKAKLEELESTLTEYLLKMKESKDLHNQKDDQLKEMEAQFNLTKAELNSKVKENTRILKELHEIKLDLSQKESAWKIINEKITTVKEELEHWIMQKTIQSIEAAINTQNCYKQKDDKIKGLQAQLIQSKVQIKSAVDEKKNMSVQLQKMKESLDYHMETAGRLGDLEIQLMLETRKIKSLSDENKKLSEELKETKDDLNRKEVAWKKSNEKLVHSIKSIMENDFSEHTHLEQAAILEQKPEYANFLECSFNALKLQIDNLMEKCVNSFIFGETTYQNCENDLDVICSICMEPWNSNGEHQICSLACGHYFGRSCIRKWLEQNRVTNSRKCPLCFKKAKLRDIRLHYL